jgi:hypothetical protein
MILFSQVASALVWLERGSNGAPVGAQMEVPAMMTTGCPSDDTCTAPTHWAVTQGPFPPGGTKEQPATLYGAATVAIGLPETNTRALGAVGIAWPPWEQSTVAPV